MVAKIEQRLDKSAEIQEETMKFTKKTLKELNGFQNVSRILMSPDHGGLRGSEEVVMYNGLNIAALGGDSPTRITKDIAEALFTPAELGNLVIDPQKTLTNNRRPADEYRTNLYKQAVRIALGTQFNTEVYKKTLRLVNQKGLYVNNRDKKTPKEGQVTPSMTDREVLSNEAENVTPLPTRHPSGRDE